MCTRNFFDFGFLFFRHTRNDQVLVRGHAEITFVDLRNLSQTGFQRFAWEIQNTAVFDEQGQVMFTINTFYPAKTITTTGEHIWTAFFKLNTGTFFYFRFKRIHTDTFQRVFGFRVQTV